MRLLSSPAVINFDNRDPNAIPADASLGVPVDAMRSWTSQKMFVDEWLSASFNLLITAGTGATNIGTIYLDVADDIPPGPTPENDFQPQGWSVYSSTAITPAMLSASKAWMSAVLPLEFMWARWRWVPDAAVTAGTIQGVTRLSTRA